MVSGAGAGGSPEVPKPPCASWAANCAALLPNPSAPMGGLARMIGSCTACSRARSPVEVMTAACESTAAVVVAAWSIERSPVEVVTTALSCALLGDGHSLPVCGEWKLDSLISVTRLLVDSPSSSTRTSATPRVSSRELCGAAGMRRSTTMFSALSLSSGS